MTTPSQFDDVLSSAYVHIKSVFAEPVTFHPAGGRGFQIEGIFDAAHAVIDTSGQVPHETVKPVLSLAWQDLRAAGKPAPKRMDKVVVRGVAYSIAEVMDDGHAEVRLVLVKGAARA